MGAALPILWSFPRAREGGASASGFDRRRRRGAMAAGQPSDVLARCWILASAERDRSFESARKEGRVTHFVVVSSRARGRRLGQRIRSAAPARSYGRRAAFGCACTLLDFGIGRARPLL